MHLRPRSFSELIDATFQIVRARFAALATTAAFVMVPVMLFTLLWSMVTAKQGNVSLGGNSVDLATGPVLTSESAKLVAGVLLLPASLLAIVAYVIGFGAMMYIASRAYLGEAMDVGPALARARRRFWTLLRATISKYIRAMGVFFLLSIVVAVLMPKLVAGGGGAAMVPMFLLIPVALAWGIILLLRYSVTGPVVLNEDVSGAVALTRSATLTKGSKGRLFGMFFVLFIIMYALMMTTMFFSMFVLRSMMWAQAFSNITSLVTYPFGAVLITVIYYDLRIRNEGFDLEVMAGGLGDVPALPSANAASRQPA